MQLTGMSMLSRRGPKSKHNLGTYRHQSSMMMVAFDSRGMTS